MDLWLLSHAADHVTCGIASGCGFFDFIGWSNAFGLRDAIARERGIADLKRWRH